MLSMNLDRRTFSAGAMAAMLTPVVPSNRGKEVFAAAGSTSPKKPYLFNDPTFETIFLTSLGRTYHLGGNAGKVLYLTRQVEDGNYETAFQAFKAAG